MENLLLKQNCNCKTPNIYFKSTGELSISGRSIAENITEYYKPALNWICSLMNYPPEKIELTIQLEYFNSKSSRILLHLIKLLEQLQIKGKSKVVINWLYDEYDEDMLEAGSDYQSIVNVPFNFLALAEY